VTVTEAQIIHIIDFGLAKQFCDSKGRWALVACSWGLVAHALALALNSCSRPLIPSSATLSLPSSVTPSLPSSVTLLVIR
jgi:hypothetical protein